MKRFIQQSQNQVINRAASARMKMSYSFPLVPNNRMAILLDLQHLLHRLLKQEVNGLNERTRLKPTALMYGIQLLRVLRTDSNLLEVWRLFLSLPDLAECPNLCKDIFKIFHLFSA